MSCFDLGTCCCRTTLDSEKQENCFLNRMYSYEGTGAPSFTKKSQNHFVKPSALNLGIIVLQSPDVCSGCAVSAFSKSV